jgi:uncharacterized repeat protein (TIGR04042 family)
MPEVRFRIRWPDDRLEICYSPSTAIKTVFEPGRAYPLADFLARSEEGLNRASERVRQVYGFACSSAHAQLLSLRETAARYADLPDAHVTVEAFEG